MIVMMERFFRSLGVDWHQFKALLVVSIRMDFRTQQKGGIKHRKRSPIFHSLFFYGLMSFSLASGLAARASLSFFSLLMVTYSMVMVMFAVILEFGNIIIQSDDADVLLHRPIGSRTYFFAKYCNFLFYIVLISMASSFFPSLIGLFIQGASWIFPFVFLSVTIIANITAASFIVWIYTGLLKILKVELFKDILVYVQIGFAFLIFLVYQLIPQVVGESHSFGISGKWTYFTPPAWYAGIIQMLTEKSNQVVQHAAFIGLMVTVMLIFLSFRKISLQYARLISDMQTSSESLSIQSTQKCITSRTGFLNPWIKKVLQHSESVAGFFLASHMIRHDRFVKMSIYPVFGIPFAVIALAIIEKRMVDPFVVESVSELGGMSSVIVFFVFFMIYSFMTSMANSSDWEASWLYQIAPVQSAGRLYRGVKLALLLRLIFPFFILLGVVYCVQIPWIHGFQYTLSLFFTALVGFSVCTFFIQDYPFSVKRERGEGSRRFSLLLFVIPFLGLTLLFQQTAYKSRLTWGIVQVGLLVLFIVLEYLSEKRLNRKLKYREMLT